MPDFCYLDSSGLVKLVIPEAESDALREYLLGRRERITSAIARVEVVRNVARQGTEVVADARRMLRGLEFVNINHALLEAAIRITPATIRTLDAIHLASALSLGDALGSFVTYDRRMREAGIAMGLPIISPE